MKAVRTLKSQAGFSLIELMIVVAIIGILATVAIPNFTKFQAKARASESRAQLAALFTSQKAFNAEWNSYLSDLVATGYRPQGALRYVTGFGAGYNGGAAYVAAAGPYVATDFNTGVATTCAAAGCTTIATDVAGAALGAGAIAAANVPTMVAFTAMAAGYVGGTAIDTWTINQNKAVINTVPGGY